MEKKDLNTKKHFKCESGAGTTLIELIVVLAVFSIVITATVGMFMSIIQQQRKILVEQELLNQVNYVIEYMSRNSRVAVIDSTGSCIGSSSIYLLTRHNSTSGFYQGVKFIGRDDVCQEFFLDSDGILKEIKGAGSAQNILSSKFIIKYARFIIDGNKTVQVAPQSSTIRPRVTFSLNIEMQTPTGQQEKIFQTTVSQRNLIN